MGRVALIIDWIKLEELAGQGVYTLREVATLLGLKNNSSLFHAIRRRYKMSWDELQFSLNIANIAAARQRIWDLAKTGDKWALTILAKSKLGFSEKQLVELSGPGGTPLQLMVAALSDEDLRARRMELEGKLNAKEFTESGTLQEPALLA